MGFPIICLNKVAHFIKKTDKKAVIYRQNWFFLSVYASLKVQESVNTYKRYFSYREIL